MTSKIAEIGKICRFCLRQDGLVSLSEATSCSFSIDDVIRYTGIQITCIKLPYAICNECSEVITNAINYRRTCLRNNITFKKIFAILNAHDIAVRREIAKAAFPNILNIDSQHDTAAAITVEAPESETPMPTLDDNDSDDSGSSSSGNVEVTNDNASEQQASTLGDERKNTETSSEQPSLEICDGSDSDYSMPSLYSEVMQEVNVNQNDNISAESSNLATAYTTDDNGSTTMQECVRSDLLELDLIESNDGDSDYSLPSIYEEAMEQSWREQRNEYGERIEKVRPKYEREQLCPLCGLMSTCITNHLRKVHNRVKQFPCPYCSKQTFDKITLKIHINTWHEKHIIKTCEKCGKGFTNKSSHFYHMKNTHGVCAVYECKTCGRKMKSIDGYKKHLKEHSLTSYPCNQCDKLFRNTVTLEKHRLRYHPD